MKRTVKLIRGGMAALVVLTAASLTLMASDAGAADAAAQLGPQELVTKVAQDTLRDLDAHRAEYKQNPKPRSFLGTGVRSGRPKRSQP